MTNYQELYELERRRADICEGQILELRRRVAALETELRDANNSVRFFQARLAEEIEKKKRLKAANRRLRATPAPQEEPT